MQRALAAALDGKVGAGVFLDPWSGEVLALVSKPAYDPNRFADGLTADEWREISDDPQRPLHDRAIASFYAPGSTFKTLMALAGLESGTISPQETVFCGGSTTIHGRRRLCWKRGGHGTVDLRAALTHSCNVYFYHLGRRLDIDTIHEYGDRFNLGRLTGIDLTGEASGVLPSRRWKQEQLREPWYPGDTISVAIGQGLLAVTPIQMATLMSGVATGGRIPRPHLVRNTAAPPRQVPMRAETTAIIHRALRDVVDHGTGRQARPKSTTAAGKTGTAQLFVHSAGVDSDLLPEDERDHAWFVGYAPAESPRIAFAVIVEHGGHGGTSAAPIVRQVLDVFFGEPAAPPLAAPGPTAGAQPEEPRVDATATAAG
jgi:penicillin-binding protein 2